LYTKKASLYFALATIILVLGIFLQDWQLATLVLALA